MLAKPGDAGETRCRWYFQANLALPTVSLVERLARDLLHIGYLSQFEGF